jgi:hypothetical protein
MAFDKKEWQRKYMRNYMRLRRKSVKTVVKTIQPTPAKKLESPNKSPNITPVVPNAINKTTPTLITTHRFEIHVPIVRSPTSLTNVQYRVKGAGKRIRYAVVDMTNCFVEFYKKSVTLVLKSGHEIVNADPEQVKALYHVLATVTKSRGVQLAPEANWEHGLYSHTVMEDDGLNDFFKPLAVAEWGDEDLHFFLDNSHTGKVEAGGKRSFDAAENLRFMLLEFPKAFAAYNENIVKHLAVLDEMSQTLKAIREELNKR